MKKIIKSIQFKSAMLMVLVSVISGFLITVVYMFTNPIIIENELKTELLIYQQVMPNIQDKSILKDEVNFKAILALDDQKETLGVIYLVTETNQHGDFTIIAAVDKTGIVLEATFLNYTQSSGVYEMTSIENLNAFIGVHVNSEPSSGDLTTGATNSLDSIKQAFLTIRNFHQTFTFETDNPFSNNVIGFNSIETDESFLPTDSVLEKQYIKNDQNEVIAFVYTLYGFGEYGDGYEPASIQFYVVTDIENNILNVVVFDNEYHHSKGAFYTRIKQYLNGIIGKNLNETVVYDIDWTAGATSGNSKQVVDEMIRALQEVLS